MREKSATSFARSGKISLPPAILVGKILNIPTVATIGDYIVICPIGICLFRGLAPQPGQALFDGPHGFLFFVNTEIPLFLSKYHSSDNALTKILKIHFSNQRLVCLPLAQIFA